jgi:hypothetical protein
MAVFKPDVLRKRKNDFQDTFVELRLGAVRIQTAIRIRKKASQQAHTVSFQSFFKFRICIFYHP